MANVYIGVDGGGTKTLALCADETGRICGVGRAGGSNWEDIGVDAASTVLMDSIGKAVGAAGCGPEDIRHIHFGLSGMDWPSDPPMLEKVLRNKGLLCHISIENDAFLYIRSSSPDSRGIGVGAGTAFCCSIIPPLGEPYFYGGFMDQGGGHDIESQVVHAVIREADGRGQPTALTPLLLRDSGFDTIEDLVFKMCRRGFHFERNAVRRLLFAVANQGDSVAAGIVRSLAAEMALAVSTLASRFNMTRTSVNVVAAGSLFLKTGTMLFDTFAQMVVRTLPSANIIAASVPPAAGALRAALQAEGKETEQSWRNVRDGIPAQ